MGSHKEPQSFFFLHTSFSLFFDAIKIHLWKLIYLSVLSSALAQWNSQCINLQGRKIFWKSSPLPTQRKEDSSTAPRPPSNSELTPPFTYRVSPLISSPSACCMTWPHYASSVCLLFLDLPLLRLLEEITILPGSTAGAWCPISTGPSGLLSNKSF